VAQNAVTDVANGSGQLVGEDVGCNHKGFQIGRHLELLSRGTHLEALLRAETAGPYRNPPFHIKPLGDVGHRRERGDLS
jgi:hypothetical protein